MSKSLAHPSSADHGVRDVSDRAPIPEVDVTPRKSQLCLAGLVRAHAESSPSAVAVTHGKLAMSYGELEQRADGLAQLLKELGVGPDVVVGLHLHRSLAAIVAALAVVKAGGAFLPVDPSYPRERLALVLEDAHARVIITEHGKSATLPAAAVQIVTIDPQGRLPDSGKVAPIIEAATPDNLAYVIYTSGSTGEPKGVEVTRRGLLNLIAWHQRAFGVTVADRASHLAALGFDAAVWEVWPYLTAGASVHLPDGLSVSDPVAVRDWLLSQAITIGFLATPLAERVITLDWPKKSSLRVLLTGADTLHHYPSRKLPFKLVNNYGPTECTVVSTSSTIHPAETPDRLPPIGRPIDNVRVHLLNQEMREVPRGEAGEIYVGGPGLARGYRNRPDLTGQRFIPDPFSSDPQARLYRTGDLGRYLPDGQIAFLGRTDEQVKIRGYRIEPAEIVKILDEHPAVQASTVIAAEFEPGDKRLIAYLVPACNTQPAASELRNFLASRMPDYMVPTAFVRLCALPVNPSGKIDRSALPAPSSENTLRDSVFVAPRNPIEERVAAMLGSLLGLERVSIDDNFFLLGGHSLLGTQLIARIRDAFGVELSLRSLFEAPTASELSQHVEALLVAKLEAMSEEEAQRLVNSITPAAA